MGAKTPVGMTVEVAGEAATKAGQIIRKPVVGRKRVRTLTYTTEIERDGKIVKATVTELEEHSGQVGGIGAALIAFGALLGLSAVAGAVSSTNKRIAKREE